jgi:hypothetical protein
MVWYLKDSGGINAVAVPQSAGDVAEDFTLKLLASKASTPVSLVELLDCIGSKIRLILQRRSPRNGSVDILHKSFDKR